MVAGAMLLSVASAQYYPHDYNTGAFEFTVYPKFPTKISVDVTQAGAYQVVIPKEYLYPGFAFSIQIEVQNDSDRPVRFWSGTIEERLEDMPINGDVKLLGGPVDPDDTAFVVDPRDTGWLKWELEVAPEGNTYLFGDERLDADDLSFVFTVDAVGVVPDEPEVPVTNSVGELP